MKCIKILQLGFERSTNDNKFIQIEFFNVSFNSPELVFCDQFFQDSLSYR